MAKVSLPAGMKKYFDGKTEVEVSGTKLSDVLKEIERQFPSSKDRVITGDGAICRYIRIFVDGDDSSELDQLETPVGKNSRVKILMALAGG